MFVLLSLLPTPVAALVADDNRYAPEWAGIIPTRIIKHTDTNGDALVKAVAALQPGDQLLISAGTYSIQRMWDVQVSGTAAAPVWIVAEEGAHVVITRPDAKQNVMNIGQGGPVKYLCLRGVEITGGSHGLRLGQCSDVWIDRCHIHHTGNVNLSANSASTRRLFLTRNHNHHGGGHGEGMYLGANNGEHIMSESVIALNHIHDCFGDQGDGIEVKQVPGETSLPRTTFMTRITHASLCMAPQESRSTSSNEICAAEAMTMQCKSREKPLFATIYS